jgi:hypothetical protein
MKQWKFRIVGRQMKVMVRREFWKGFLVSWVYDKQRHWEIQKKKSVVLREDGCFSRYILSWEINWIEHRDNVWREINWFPWVFEWFWFFISSFLMDFSMIYFGIFLWIEFLTNFKLLVFGFEIFFFFSYFLNHLVIFDGSLD